MATTTFQQTRDFSTNKSLSLAIPIYVYVSVVCSMMVILGILWDIAWHMSIGRDGLFSAPHVVVYIGAATAGIVAGFQVLKTSFWGSETEKNRMVNFWKIFYSSLGGLFCIWGGIAAITSAPFDDWWHNTYGLDVQIFSPPHTVLLLGLMSVQIGAMMTVLAILNRKDRIDTLTNQQNEARNQRLQWMFVLTAGFFITTLFTFMFEFLGRWNMHSSIFYQISATIFPFSLFAMARATGMKWGATNIALVYFVFFWAVNAVLRLFPAEPLLGPINNPITHYQTMGFPLLLFIPAFVIDFLRAKYSQKNDWVLALILGISFVLMMLLVHYFWGNFIHESPLARNWFFGSDSWSYNNDADWEYRYKFTTWVKKDFAYWAKGLGIAFLIGFISSRIGLAWGNWMRKVQR